MRKLVVAIFGSTLLMLGIALIVLPGPAFLVIPSGLAILATEFLWARRALQRCGGLAGKAGQGLRWRWNQLLGTVRIRRLAPRRNAAKARRRNQQPSPARP